MAMFGDESFLFNQNDMLFISEQQKAGVVIACVAAAMADGTIEQSELTKMEEKFLQIPWGLPDQKIIDWVHGAQVKLAELKDAAGVQSFITKTAAVLPPGPIREKTLYLIASVMFADKNINQNEMALLNAFADAFAIPMERQKAIGAAILKGA
jgi:uncharacterized membrane protein YebE (DUF533 family)